MFIKNSYIWFVAVFTVLCTAQGAMAQSYSSQYITSVYRGGGSSGFDRGDWSNIGCKRADFIEDRYVMDVDRDKGPFDKLRLKISSDDFHIVGLQVVFYNGERTRLVVRSEDSYPGRGVILNLPSRGRYLKKIIMHYASRVSSYRPIVVCIDAHEVADRSYGGSSSGYGNDNYDDDRNDDYNRPDDYDRPIPTRSAWASLGCISVRHKTGHKYYRVGRSKGRFTAIRLHIKNQPAKIKNLSVTFGNGQKKDLGLYGTFGSGRYSPVYRFGKRGRFIKVVDIVFKSRLFLVKTKVCLEGKRAGRSSGGYSSGAEEEDYGAARWKSFGCVSFNRTSRRSKFFTLGRRKGRLKEIRLKVSGQPFRLYNLGVVYGNGRDGVLARSETRIRSGGVSRAYRFRGKRYVNEIEIVGSRARFSGQSRVCLQGR